jgi:hypothetical protein
LNTDLPKNIGDVIYSFRYRAELPDSIRATAVPGQEWIIRPNGRAKYRFALVGQTDFLPASNLVETKILDSTPGVISRYAQTDEQALLAILRYNRLVDIFTGLACYSLQSHLRTTAKKLGQVEIDELYIGVDKRGAHFVLPVQAKGGNDKLGTVQIEQDIAVCHEKFSDLICIPIGAQFIESNLIALFAFEISGDEVAIASEKHYRLVGPDEISVNELLKYSKRID